MLLRKDIFHSLQRTVPCVVITEGSVTNMATKSSAGAKITSLAISVSSIVSKYLTGALHFSAYFLYFGIMQHRVLPQSTKARKNTSFIW